MILQQWLVLALECTLICISSHASPQKRQCAFQVTSQTSAYSAAGNVSGSVQLCKNTQCCVGFYHMSEGQLKVDVLACDVVEKSCPDATCKGQPRVNNNYIMCVCNTDLCNSNITWTTELEHPPRIYSATELKKTAVNVLVVTLLLICFGIIALKWKKASLQSSHPDFSAPAPCSCHTTRTSEIDIDHIELQQVVGQGHFATVFQGKYKGSMVAVKVLPAGWKYKFAAEKEIYELPLMKHGGIVHFLGSGRKPDDSSWFIVLQLAEYGSLHSFLCKQTSSWMVSLKLCQSLSQGLSHLHSELGSNDVHKPPVAHGDLSSFNVLVRADGTCALCDFGCSTILCSCSRCRCWRGHAANMEGHTQMGTLNYMSPEILEGSVNLSSRYFLMQGDVYALGLLLWEIWMRCSDLFESSVVPQYLLPYELELGTSVTLDSLILFVSHMDKRPSIPEHWELLPQGSALKEILTECWDCEPDARLTAQRVVDRLVCLQFSYSL